MSLATLAAPGAVESPSPSVGSGDYVTLAEAGRILECHPTTAQRLALAGRIRTRIRKGRVVYHAEDCRACR